MKFPYECELFNLFFDWNIKKTATSATVTTAAVVAVVTETR